MPPSRSSKLADDWVRPPPPNMPPKTSSKPPELPGAVKRAPEPIARIWSYSLRSAGSESTEWASLISLKRASALGSPGLESGWYWRASLR